MACSLLKLAADKPCPLLQNSLHCSALLSVKTTAFKKPAFKKPCLPVQKKAFKIKIRYLRIIIIQIKVNLKTLCSSKNNRIVLILLKIFPSTNF